MRWPDIRLANLGFSSSSRDPSCTNGPYWPMRTLTGLPVAGSVPIGRDSATSSRLTLVAISSTRRLNGCQNRSSSGCHCRSPLLISSRTSSIRAVKP
jgi:hypothetical protein